jgi:hypothetical protein
VIDYYFCSRCGHTVDFAYARLNQLSVDRQSNYVSDVRRRPTINAKILRRTILTRQQNLVFHGDLPTIASFIGDEAVELTLDASQMFQMLGLVEIDVIRREIVREAIKFLRYAPQYLFHVRLDGHFRQSPGVIGL